MEIGDIIYISGIECRIIAFGQFYDRAVLVHDDIACTLDIKIDNILDNIHTIVKGKYTYSGQPISVHPKDDYIIKERCLGNTYLGDIVQRENGIIERSMDKGRTTCINRIEWEIYSSTSVISIVLAEHEDVIFIIGKEPDKSIYTSYAKLPIYRKEDISFLADAYALEQ